MYYRGIQIDIGVGDFCTHVLRRYYDYEKAVPQTNHFVCQTIDILIKVIAPTLISITSR